MSYKTVACPPALEAPHCSTFHDAVYSRQKEERLTGNIISHDVLAQLAEPDILLNHFPLSRRVDTHRFDDGWLPTVIARTLCLSLPGRRDANDLQHLTMEDNFLPILLDLFATIRRINLEKPGPERMLQASSISSHPHAITFSLVGACLEAVGPVVSRILVIPWTIHPHLQGFLHRFSAQTHGFPGNFNQGSK